MVDTAITDLPAQPAALVDADLIETVDDVGGTPTSTKSTLTQLSTYMAGSLNVSGTNTGDQTSIVGITGTKAEFDTAVTDGNITYDGDNVSVLTNDAGYITESSSDTLTSKTIDGDNNTITNLLIGFEVSPAVGVDLTDVQAIVLDGTPDTDHTATGFTTNTFNAGTTIAQSELVYMASDGEWALADADAEATAGGVMLAIALEAGTDGNPINVAIAGSFVRDDTFAFTIGAELYVSTTAGVITETAPSGTADIVRVIGYAVSADVFYFNPASSWGEAL